MVKIMGPNPKTKKTTFLDVWVYYVGIWVFPRIGVPQNGWFIMETPIKMDDLGVALFLETPISNKKIRQVSPGLCVSWWAKDRDGWVFYLLNGEQRIATRWGLSTSQCIVIVFNWLVFFPGPNGNEMEGGGFWKTPSSKELRFWKQTWMIRFFWEGHRWQVPCSLKSLERKEPILAAGVVFESHFWWKWLLKRFGAKFCKMTRHLQAELSIFLSCKYICLLGVF